jgi:hypothetical protein
MRVFFLLLTILFSTICSSIAQKRGEHDITTPYADLKDLNGEITHVKEAPKFVGRVPGVVGTNYSASDINNLPTRNINKIACLTLGVQANGNREPIFKGVEGGTAYFVDGVRIRSGNLSLAGFGF